MNDDGQVDLAVANGDSDDVSVLLNQGNGAFATPGNCAAGANPVSVAAADLNGDGELDLAVANGDSDDVSILLSPCGP